MIGSILSSSLVSYYTLALSISSFIYFGVSSLETSCFPLWLKHISNNSIKSINSDYKVLTKLGIIIGSIIFNPIFISTNNIIKVLFHENYLEMSLIIKSFALIFLLNTLTGPNESLLKALGSFKIIMRSRLVVGMLVIIFYYPLIKLFGIYGAVLTFAISTIVGSVINYAYELYNKFKIHPFDINFFKIVLLIIISNAVSYFLYSLFSVESLSILTNVAIILANVSTYIVILSLLIFIFYKITHSEYSILKSFINDKIN